MSKLNIKSKLLNSITNDYEIILKEKLQAIEKEYWETKKNIEENVQFDYSVYFVNDKIFYSKLLNPNFKANKTLYDLRIERLCRDFEALIKRQSDFEYNIRDAQ